MVKKANFDDIIRDTVIKNLDFISAGPVIQSVRDDGAWSAGSSY